MIKDIAQEYINCDKEIDLIISSMAYEAESVNNEEEKVNKGNILFKKIGDLINKIVAMVERAITNVKNFFQKALLTDKGFTKELREAEVNRRPLNAVKVISYKYIPDYIKGVNSNFKLILEKLINDTNTLYNSNESKQSPLSLGKSEFISYIFKELKAPSNIDDMTVYFKFLREKFRGDKLELVLKSTELPKYIKITQGYEILKGSLDKDLTFIKLKINKVKNPLKVAVKNPNISDSNKSIIMKKITNLAVLYNLYTNFCNINLELNVEYMLTTRTIVKKFYQL